VSFSQPMSINCLSYGLRAGPGRLGRGHCWIFFEAHPDPDQALSDGPSALPLDLVKPFLTQMKAVDDLVNSLPALVIE